jgi:hypothetical protein
MWVTYIHLHKADQDIHTNSSPNTLRPTYIAQARHTHITYPHPIHTKLQKTHIVPPLLNASTWNHAHNTKSDQIPIPPNKFSSQFSTKSSNSSKTKKFTSWPNFRWIYVCTPSLNFPPKIQNLKTWFNSGQLTVISAISRSPLLKGPCPDLILFVTRLL